MDLLLEYGFLYDSSCMGNDFSPYYLREGGEWSTTEPYIFGEPYELVEVPVTWGFDDFPASEYVSGHNTGLMPPSTVEEIWKGDSEHAHGNVNPLDRWASENPLYAGRGPHMKHTGKRGEET